MEPVQIAERSTRMQTRKEDSTESVQTANPKGEDGSQASVKEATQLRVDAPEILSSIREMAVYEKAMGTRIAIYIYSPMDNQTRRFAERKGFIRVLIVRTKKKPVWKVRLTPWGREVAMS